MFVGRETELADLERLYAKKTFQMVVVYGRRRVGKTTLLGQFARGKRALQFTAQEQTNANNLSDFTRAVREFFDLPPAGDFASWTDAFDYLADRAAEEPFLLIFDEFPYAAQADKSLLSKLQVAIDHKFAATGMFLVLCGSNQGFMESDVLGRKSPLHGRRTGQIKLDPFGFRDAARMLPGVSTEDRFRYYACVGGVPYYLSQVDERLSFDENMKSLFFKPTGFLYEEPLMLLRQELREPALYNSILRAIASGATRQGQIADRAGIGATSIPRYLRTLLDLGLVERRMPFGENPQTSRKSIYRLREACYDYWYRFVAPFENDIEAGAGAVVHDLLPANALDTYLGRWFERVCGEWLMEQVIAGRLPLPATGTGSWWGPHPERHEQTDIDCLAVDRVGKKLLIGECKWRSGIDVSQVIEGLEGKRSCIPHYDAEWFCLFTRHPVEATVRDRYAASSNVRFVSLAEIYGG